MYIYTRTLPEYTYFFQFSFRSIYYEICIIFITFSGNGICVYSETARLDTNSLHILYIESNIKWQGFLEVRFTFLQRTYLLSLSHKCNVFIVICFKLQYQYVYYVVLFQLRLSNILITYFILQNNNLRSSRHSVSAKLVKRNAPEAVNRGE